jgi:hypothetical protein
MHLNNIKLAWKQLKVMNAIQIIESNEILSIIEKPENMNTIKLQRFVFGLVIFIFITIFCQGG